MNAPVHPTTFDVLARTCWSQQSTAASLIADCAKRLPETAESTSISLAGHRNTNSHYTYRDERVRTLRKLRRSWIERTFKSAEDRYDAQTNLVGVDEAIDAAASCLTRLLPTRVGHLVCDA